MGATRTPPSPPTEASEPVEASASGRVGGVEKVQDVLVPWVLQSGRKGTSERGEARDKEELKVYHRYYHLFTKGELRDLINEAAMEEGYLVLANEGARTVGEDEKWLRCRGEGWEADNWWFEGEVGIGPPMK